MGASVGACIRLCWGLYGSAGGFPGASALIVRHSCKFSRFRLPCAIAFPRSFNKSVLRAFLGGLFGFIGQRCIFGWLRCFAWLVGLYACIVRRLRTEKRKRTYFCGLRSCCCFWLLLVLWLLLRSWCLRWLCLVVVLLVAFFPFRTV